MGILGVLVTQVTVVSCMLLHWKSAILIRVLEWTSLACIAIMNRMPVLISKLKVLWHRKLVLTMYVVVKVRHTTKHGLRPSIIPKLPFVPTNSLDTGLVPACFRHRSDRRKQSIPRRV